MRKRRSRGALYMGDGWPFTTAQIQLIAEFGGLEIADVEFIVGLTVMAFRAEEATDAYDEPIDGGEVTHDQ